MTTTRRDVLKTAATAAGAAATGDVADAGHDHDHQAVPSDVALRVNSVPDPGT